MSYLEGYTAAVNELKTYAERLESRISSLEQARPSPTAITPNHSCPPNAEWVRSDEDGHAVTRCGGCGLQLRELAKANGHT